METTKVFVSAKRNDWADLATSVSKLKGANDYDRWDIALSDYLKGKGAYGHLLGKRREPYRRVDIVDGVDQYVTPDLELGEAPPRGPYLDVDTLREKLGPTISKRYDDLVAKGVVTPTQAVVSTDVSLISCLSAQLSSPKTPSKGSSVLPPMSTLLSKRPEAEDDMIKPADKDLSLSQIETQIEKQVLNNRELATWSDWANNERLARVAILKTIPDDLAIDVREKFSAQDIYKHLKTRFRKENVSRISQIKAKVHSTRLQAGANSVVCNTFFKSFITNYAAMARLQKPYADDEKVSTIIGALPVTYKILIETTWRAQIDKTWDNFTSVFYDFINDLKNTERIPAVESNASLTITKGGKAGQPNASRTKKGKDGKVAKHCDNHPTSTSHDTSECVRGPPKKGDKKKDQKQVDKAPTPAPTSSASIIEIEDAYYDGSSSSMTVEYFSSSSSSSFKFLVDTGCTEHIVGNQSILFGVKPVPVPLRVRLGGSRFHLILSTVGSMRIAQDDNTTVIHDVYYSADTTDLTISTKALRRHGWTVDLHNFRISKGKVVFKTDNSYEGGRPAVDLQVTSSSYAAMTTRRPPSTSTSVKPSNAPRTQSIPTLDATQTSAQTPQTPVVAPRSTRSSRSQTATTTQTTSAEPSIALQVRERSPSILYRLHHRLGHVGRPVLIRLIKNGEIDGVSLDDVKNDNFKLNDCNHCLAHKATTRTGKGPSPRGRDARHEFIHADIKNFTQPNSKGQRHWLSIVTDFTGWRTGIPLVEKNAATPQLMHEIVALQKNCGVSVVVIRTDNGTEFVNATLRDFTSRLGIRHQQSPPYSQAYNGVAERFNRTLSEMVRTMLAAAGLTHDLWDHAMRYAVTILNMTSIHPDGKSPYEVYYGRKPNLAKLLPFGQRVYARRRQKQTQVAALERPRAIPARILNTNADTPGWVVLTDEGQIYHFADVYVANNGQQGRRIPDYDDEDVPPTLLDEDEDAVDDVETQVPPETLDAISDDLNEDEEDEADAHASSATSVNHRPRTKDDLDFAYLASSAAQETFTDPIALAEALNSTERALWIAAMQAELDNLSSKGTWTEVKVPQGRRPITAKWVFKRKRDTNGVVVKYKARLVARGFDQTPGVDFEETYAPVSRLGSLRILLAHAATFNLQIRQMDVEGAYLNGSLQEELYLAPPPGLTLDDKACDGLRLNKALYGLKQSGRAWWLELSRALDELGFTRCPSEWGVHVRRRKHGSIAYVLAYVDDILIFTHSKTEADDIINALRKHWVLTDLGEPTQMLSLAIARDRANRTVSISSKAYIELLVVRFKLDKVKTGRYAPLPTGEAHQLVPADDNTLVDAIDKSLYAVMAGCVVWLSITCRPDLSYPATILTRVQHAPTQEAMNMARRVLNYAAETHSFALVLSNKFPTDLIHAYADADYAGCVVTRRSTSGYVVYLYDSPISWASRRQGSVATSTTATEYIAMSETAAEVQWLRQYLTELYMFKQKEPITIFVDNLSAIAIARKPVSFPLSKHIDVKHHHVRELVDKGVITLKYVGTAQQKADGMTKALGGTPHTLATRALGLKDVKQL
jgi:transposase InsO family protein